MGKRVQASNACSAQKGGINIAHEALIQVFPDF